MGGQVVDWNNGKAGKMVGKGCSGIALMADSYWGERVGNLEDAGLIAEGG